MNRAPNDPPDASAGRWRVPLTHEQAFALVLAHERATIGSVHDGPAGEEAAMRYGILRAALFRLLTGGEARAVLETVLADAG